MSESDPILMTLAGIAYGAPQAIQRYLDESPITKGNWTLVWLPILPNPPINFAFLARSTKTGACVIAIRGTYPNPFSPAYWDDGDEDSPYGDMVDWPLGSSCAPGTLCPQIGGGTARGLAGLLALTDAGGVTLQDAVAALDPNVPLTVTGHSLGGTLAPVLALHLSEAVTGRTIFATSFAGMTPGNAAFADLFGPGTPLHGCVRRVFNTLDTVAYGWDRVYDTHTFYEPAPKGGVLVSAMLLASAARLALGRYGYTPVGDPCALTGVLRPIAISCELIAYVFENLHQHMPDTYLELLGAPPLPFAIVYSSIVLPRDHPAAANVIATRSPTVYVA